jgi:hypothetical protein
MLGVHCGFTEDEILNFSYLYYKDCIAELAIVFRYNAVSHVLSNPYAGEEGSKMVESSNPFNVKQGEAKAVKKPKATMGLLNNLGIFSNKSK